MLAVLLVIGGIAGAVALTGGDDDSGSASGGTSETADPSETASGPTESPTEATPTEETESADPAPTGSGEPFTAEYNFDVEKVCNGGAMTNAAAYDPSKPKIMGFYNKVDDPERWIGDSSGYGQPWQVEYDDYKEVSVVACMKAGEQGEGISVPVREQQGQEDRLHLRPGRLHADLRGGADRRGHRRG